MSIPLQIDIREGVLTANIVGKIDSQTAPTLQTQLLEQLGEATCAVFDVSQISYMSSAGFRLLLLIYRTLSMNGGRLVLVGLVEEIRDTMEMTGFLEFFVLHDTLENALLEVRNHADYAAAR